MPGLAVLRPHVHRRRVWKTAPRSARAGLCGSGIAVRRPDDWHLHLRDGAMLQAVLPETARHFARAIIMPNLVPPGGHRWTRPRAYRDRILAALPAGHGFRAADDAVPDRRHRPRRCGRRRCLGPGQGGEALPRRGHDQFALRRARLWPRSCPCWKRWPRSACRSACMAR